MRKILLDIAIEDVKPKVYLRDLTKISTDKSWLSYVICVRLEPNQNQICSSLGCIRAEMVNLGFVIGANPINLVIYPWICPIIRHLELGI